MVKIIKANNIYLTCGVPVLPWEVDKWPDDWLDAITEFAYELPEKQRKKLNG